MRIPNTVIKAVALGLPPLLVQYADLQLSKTPLIFQSTLKSFFTNHPKTTLAAFFASIPIMVFTDWISEYRKERSEKSKPNTEDLIALITSLDRIVGEKKKRFNDYFKTITGKVNACEIFDHITQPKAQIDLLLMELFHYIYERADKDKSIQITLARMRKNKVLEWYSYIPTNDAPSDSLKTSTQSAFYLASKSHSPVYIDDIAKKISNNSYHIISRDSIGSLIAIPIEDSSQAVRYVLCIKINAVNLLNRQFHQKHKLLIGSIIKRIVLESNLVELKSTSLKKGACQ